MICNACSGTSFKPFAIRADGMEIKRCSYCGLGVIANLPESTQAYYDDNYYVNGTSSGYADYNFMAEHGLGWAAALVRLLADHGKILDIGCADGYLLDKFTSAFDKSGIEVNAKAAGQARDKGIQLLGNDLLDSQLVHDHRAGFDVVTAIAVFEHLLDFRGGFHAAIELLKDDGFLLFEVPVMSAEASNAAWLNSSLEHIYYPTEGAIRHIVETELGAHLIGAEVLIKDYASTYVGIVTKNERQAARVKEVFERVMSADFDGATAEETKALTHLYLLHAGQATEASVRSLTRLDGSEFTPPLVARIAQLWSFDLKRLQSGAWQPVSFGAAGREVQRLKGEVEVILADARLNAAQATEAINFEIRRAAEREGEAAALRRKLAEEAAKTAAMEHRALEAAGRLEAMQQTIAWRATTPMRRWATNNPRAARRAKQVAKLAWWTLRGRIFDHLREFRRRRALAGGGARNLEAARRTAAAVRLLAPAGVVPDAVKPPSGADWPLDRPLVSIVIPCFNYGHLVGEAIRSVEAQTFTDIEIIVVEGGSSSPESRQRLIDAVSTASPKLRLLLQDQPYRAGANRNFGISHARGKYICCLDADDRIAPTYIEKAVFMLEHSGYGVVSPGLQFFGDRSDVWTPHERPTLDMLLDGNNALTCAVYSKEFWRKAGGYRDTDPTTGHVHEDWLFWVRLAALGARFIGIREPLFHYRSHGNTLSNRSDVLDNEIQKLLVRRFNDDVLTEDALQSVRSASASPPVRPPQSFAARRDFHVQAATGPTLLIALPFLVLGGAERLLSAIVAQLVRNGWRVVIVTTVPVGQTHGDTTSWFESATPEIFHLPRFLEAEYWRDFLDHLLQSRDVQILWVIGSAFAYDCLPAWKLRYPRLAVADLLFNTVGHTANNRRYADCIDLTFIENTEVREWLIAAGESPERISLVESGVDLDQNAPAAPGQLSVMAGDIPEDATVVGFFGRWSEEKDPLGFVEIAKRIPNESNVVFLMTGTGSLEPELRLAIAAANFPPGRFLLKGSVPDLKPYLQACDILCLPSRLDGRPNIIMEALASGAAVIASRVGALPDMIEEGRQGYLCAPGAYDEFARRIEELASDKQKLQNFQLAARAFAESRFDIQAMLRQYEGELRRLIGRG
ncbi:glycosyltransferase [Variovorax sp. YR752]|uniref:glycosyltransferase n=1 Tax=Variovorax sp. YR752 TaxID=1884383 RepID=UPI003137FDDC